MSAQTTLIGNTTADVELRYSQAGKPIASLTVAVSDRKFDKQANEWVDGDVWFARCTIFGAMAEHAAGSILKGTRVVANGRIVQRSWDDKDGAKRSSVEVLLDEIGPSLRYATAQVTRTERQAGHGGPQTSNTGAGDPWGTPTPQAGAQAGGYDDSSVPF